jgi:hypothetical protein
MASPLRSSTSPPAVKTTPAPTLSQPKVVTTGNTAVASSTPSGTLARPLLQNPSLVFPPSAPRAAPPPLPPTPRPALPPPQPKLTAPAPAPPPDAPGPTANPGTAAALIAETRLRLALQTQFNNAVTTAATREATLRRAADIARRQADAHAARAAQAERELEEMRARAEEAERRCKVVERLCTEVECARRAEAARAEGAERELEGLRALLDVREEVGPVVWDAVRMLGALADETGDAAEEGAGKMERG